MNKSKINNIYQKLASIVGENDISVSPVDKITYSRDLWSLAAMWFRAGKIPYKPDFIVWPKNEKEVSQIVKLAQQQKIPLIPFGAGSGVCGGTVPIHGGIIVDLKKMDHIIEINDKNLTVTAEPGIIGQILENELNRLGYTMGHFPSSIYCSCLGGYLSTRSAGQLSTKYGKIEDMVLSIRVVLPDGKVIHTLTTPRTATGPNLMQLFVGSEGTLGIITQATLRIFPYPEARDFRGFIFPQVQSGLEAVRKIMRKGIKPAGVRLYDELDTTMAFADQGLKIEGCLLVLLFEGSKEVVQVEKKISVKICLEEGGKDYGAKPAEHWWEHRYDISYNMAKYMREGGRLGDFAIVDTIEVASTWDRLEQLYLKMRETMWENKALVMAHFSHVYPEGGCIYFSFAARAESDKEAEKMYKDIWDGAMEACLKVGGTISHHHGIGLLRAKWMKKEYGEAFKIFEKIKKTIDSNNIMNPGKLGL